MADFIKDSQDLHKKLNEIFKIFREVQGLMSADRFLSEVEVSMLNELCNRFGELFPLCFGEPNKGDA